MNKLSEEALKIFTKTILPELKSSVEQVCFNRLLEYQVVKYKSLSLTKSFFHKQEPVPLRDFYHPLKLVCGKSIIETNNVEILFKDNSFNCITIIGTAGSGKSTLAKSIHLDCIERNFKFPITIELKELNRDDFKGNFNDYIFDSIFLYNKLGIDKKRVEKLLDNNKFVFILDGYDEIKSSLLGEVASSILKFVERFPSNNYIITSRPHSGVESINNFVNFFVKSISLNEIPQFLNKIIPDNKELQVKIISEINKPINKSYHSFVTNPLLLTLFVLTFEHHPHLPKKRIMFYEKVFDTLYQSHNYISKQNYEQEIYTKLPEEYIRDILGHFCFPTYFQDKFEFTKEEIFKFLTIIKQQYPRYSFDNNKFIKDMLKSICLLVEDGYMYKFIHRSLQEYFAVVQLNKLKSKRITEYILINPNKHINLLNLLIEKDKLYFIENILIVYIEKIIQDNSEAFDYSFQKDVQKLLRQFVAFESVLKSDYDVYNIYEKFLLTNKENVNKERKLYQQKRKIRKALNYKEDIILNCLVLENNYSILIKSYISFIESENKINRYIENIAIFGKQV